MSLAPRFVFRSCAAVFALSFAAACSLGCSGTSAGDVPPESGSTDDALKVKSGDAALADLLARTKSLTKTSSARILRAAVDPALTTARLRMLNEFGAKQPDDGERYELFGGNVQILYGSVPRDLASTPAGFGGQSFVTSIDVSEDMVGPTTFKVVGTAKSDYALAFQMADHRVEIARIPAGASAADTAKAIADAVVADKEAIMEHIFEEKGIGPDLGQYGGLDDLECSSDGDTVTISEDING